MAESQQNRSRGWIVITLASNGGDGVRVCYPTDIIGFIEEANDTNSKFEDANSVIFLRAQGSDGEAVRSLNVRNYLSDLTIQMKAAGERIGWPYSVGSVSDQSPMSGENKIQK